jgi:hypothetical protein
MKAIRMRIQKSSRPGVILLPIVLAIITSIVVANATQTITTPNAVKITYNLAAGASSATITPATSTSVLVMGCCTTSAGLGGVGVGQVTLLHIPSAFIEWTGLESPTSGSGGATITSGSATSAGHHIVYIEILHQMDIQTASKDTILIHNGSGSTLAGNVTLIW